MTTDELNAIVQAVMTELEKAGVDFDFKAETPQPTDLVYVIRGTADKYQGITVKWQNLLDIIVQKATEAKNEAVSAKDIALQTLATIQGIESNVSSMKASVETSESNVTQMKSDVSTMKSSVEGTKTEVEGLKGDVTTLKAQTQTIVDNAKEEVTGLLDTKADKTYVDGELAKKVNYTDSLTYEEIMATNPVPDLTNKVASASALKDLIKVQEFTGTTDSGGRIENYFSKDKFINAFCVSPYFGAIKYIANYSSPGLFYFVDGSTNQILANTEVTYRVILIG